MAEIILVRHGETAWSASGQHTSRTDLPLTGTGVKQARALRPALAGRAYALVLTSPRLRAVHTAELAGLSGATIDGDLAEWDYGAYEGKTSDAIHEIDPAWDLWRDGCPGGESPAEVGARLDRVLTRAEATLASGDVVLVAHGHSLRVAAARWLGLPPSAGALFDLDTATVSTLGYEHHHHVVATWNLAVPGSERSPRPAFS